VCQDSDVCQVSSGASRATYLSRSWKLLELMRPVEDLDRGALM
jgi:hypothetical protein